MTSIREPRGSVASFGLVTVLASLAWLGWFALAPNLGFPDVSPALVVERAVDTSSPSASGLAWVLVVVGVALAAVGYLVLGRHALAGSAVSAMAYAVAMWFVVGVLLMPLLGEIVENDVGPSMGAPLAMGMRPSFMMLSEGPLAPISGLIAWVVFGAGMSLAPLTRTSTQNTRLPAQLTKVVIGLGLSIAVLISLAGFALGARPDAYELWVIDQGGTGTLYIYNGSSITGTPDDATAEVIDLGEAATGVGDGPGDSPHMITFNRDRTYALIANRYSGHVYVMRVEDRQIISSIDVGEEAHDVRPSPDDEIALVSKQGDMEIGVITTDYENEEFTYDPADDLDLAPLQGPDFPDNKPRCALFPGEDRTAYVTPSGGGLFIVDANQDQLRIEKSFTAAEVTASGCGAVTRDGKLYLGWGSAETSRLYAFDHGSHSLLHAIPVNRYGPDGHGMTLVGDGRYLWMALRGSHRVAIVDLEREEIVRTLTGFGVVPDMPAVAPDGNHVFLTLRGPAFFADLPKSPLIDRTAPGIVVFEVRDEGGSGVPVRFVPLPAVRGVPADPHAMAIVPTSS